jgi:ABC-type sugar transport system ATPase subunit
VLRLDGICKLFGPALVLEDVSSDMLPGRVHALVGENGAGKSTLLRIITGLKLDNSGRVLLNGQPAHFGTPIEAGAAGDEILVEV